MKIIVPLALIIAVGCILATGCVAQIKKDPGNESVIPTITPTTSFTLFDNSSIANITNSSTGMNITNSTVLKGPLRVSISGYPITLAIMVDDVVVGNATRDKPLDLMVDEGIHTIKVCVGESCEQENIAVIFARKSFVDFGERFRKKIEFPEPTARIKEFFKNGYGVTVNVEFINPSAKDLTMDVEISCGYSYIDSRTGQRMGDSVRGRLGGEVNAGTRRTESLDLYFASGSSHNFDPPSIQSLTIR